MSDSEKLTHAIRLILQNYGTVHTGDPMDVVPLSDWVSPLRLVVAAFSAPIPGVFVLPPLLSWFCRATETNLLVIADQPIGRDVLGRAASFLQYPFDAQALCDAVSAVLKQTA